jgi:hypothetical protein
VPTKICREAAGMYGGAGAGRPLMQIDPAGLEKSSLINAFQHLEREANRHRDLYPNGAYIAVAKKHSMTY